MNPSLFDSKEREGMILYMNLGKEGHTDHQLLEKLNKLTEKEITTVLGMALNDKPLGSINASAKALLFESDYRSHFLALSGEKLEAFATCPLKKYARDVYPESKGDTSLSGLEAVRNNRPTTYSPSASFNPWIVARGREAIDGEAATAIRVTEEATYRLYHKNLIAMDAARIEAVKVYLREYGGEETDHIAVLRRYASRKMTHMPSRRKFLRMEAQMVLDSMFIYSDDFIRKSINDKELVDRLFEYRENGDDNVAELRERIVMAGGLLFKPFDETLDEGSIDDNVRYEAKPSCTL